MYEHIGIRIGAHPVLHISRIRVKTIPNIELIEISRLTSARKVTCHWLEDRALMPRRDILFPFVTCVPFLPPCAV
jgi:hypothetical protein